MICYLSTINAALAQLDRVFGYEPKGRGFESLTPYQKSRCPWGIGIFVLLGESFEPKAPGKVLGTMRPAAACAAAQTGSLAPYQKTAPAGAVFYYYYESVLRETICS